MIIITRMEAILKTSSTRNFLNPNLKEISDIKKYTKIINVICNFVFLDFIPLAYKEVIHIKNIPVDIGFIYSKQHTKLYKKEVRVIKPIFTGKKASNIQRNTQAVFMKTAKLSNTWFNP